MVKYHFLHQLIHMPSLWPHQHILLHTQWSPQAPICLISSQVTMIEIFRRERLQMLFTFRCVILQICKRAILFWRVTCTFSLQILAVTNCWVQFWQSSARVCSFDGLPIYSSLSATFDTTSTWLSLSGCHSSSATGHIESSGWFANWAII